MAGSVPQLSKSKAKNPLLGIKYKLITLLLLSTNLFDLFFEPFNTLGTKISTDLISRKIQAYLLDIRFIRSWCSILGVGSVPANYGTLSAQTACSHGVYYNIRISILKYGKYNIIPTSPYCRQHYS